MPMAHVPEVLASPMFSFGVMGSYPKCERGNEEGHEILARPAQGGGMAQPDLVVA